jgi:aminoglycoside 6'-N-acetyltransferase I
MRVRLLGPHDLRSWCGMRQALWPEAAAQDLIREAEAYLDGAGPLQAVFLAEGPAGELLGMLELSLRSYAEGCRGAPVPYVEAWYVVPEARRRGVGRDLLAASEAWSGARGYAEIASDALLDNLVSERAHRALGFEEVERAIHFRKDLQTGGAASALPPGSRTES